MDDTSQAGTAVPSATSTRSTLYERALEQRRRAEERKQKAAEEKRLKDTEEVRNVPIISPYAHRREPKGEMFYESSKSWLEKRSQHLRKKQAQLEREENAAMDPKKMPPKVNKKSAALVSSAYTPLTAVSEHQRLKDEHTKRIAEMNQPSFAPKINPSHASRQESPDAHAERLYRDYLELEAKRQKAIAEAHAAERARDNAAISHSIKRTPEEVQKYLDHMKAHQEGQTRRIAKVRESIERDRAFETPFAPELSEQTKRLANCGPRYSDPIEKKKSSMLLLHEAETVPKRVPKMSPSKEAEFLARNEKFLVSKTVNRRRFEEEHNEEKECTFHPAISAKSEQLAQGKRSRRQNQHEDPYGFPDRTYSRERSLSHQEPVPPMTMTPLTSGTSVSPPAEDVPGDFSPKPTRPAVASGSIGETLADFEATLAHWREISEQSVQ